MNTSTLFRNGTAILEPIPLVNGHLRLVRDRILVNVIWEMRRKSGERSTTHSRTHYGQGYARVLTGRWTIIGVLIFSRVLTTAIYNTLA
jgi:hypothetical protein